MASPVNPSPYLPDPPTLGDVGLVTHLINLKMALFNTFVAYAYRLNNSVPKDGSEGPVVLASYTVASVPTAASYTGGMIYVTNETGGAVPAFSDGTNWRRVTDRAIVS